MNQLEESEKLNQLQREATKLEQHLKNRLVNDKLWHEDLKRILNTIKDIRNELFACGS